MVLKTNITKVGDSLYVLIPSFIAKNIELKNGQPIDIKINGNELTINLIMEESDEED